MHRMNGKDKYEESLDDDYFIGSAPTDASGQTMKIWLYKKVSDGGGATPNTFKAVASVSNPSGIEKLREKWKEITGVEDIDTVIEEQMILKG